MPALTESFANTSDYLLSERKKAKRRPYAELFLSALLKPLLPAAVRCGTGILVDIKDRHVGPMDIVASLDNFPPFSEGQAAIYLADGALFCLQIRDWSQEDLTQFGELAQLVKKLERKKKTAIPCLAVSYGPLPLAELTQFMKSKPGQSVDGVLCVGHHLILRNYQGWYGDVAKVPFVTEQPGPEALKAFTFFLLKVAQNALGMSFGLADYQHL